MDSCTRGSRRSYRAKTEPNSGLGQAIGYLLRHWQPLTLFLRKAGAPLDNNVAERALKRAVLHRKNALFYRTLHGAQVGDLFMSLIHTCQLCGANSFDYLLLCGEQHNRSRTKPLRGTRRFQQAVVSVVLDQASPFVIFHA